MIALSIYKKDGRLLSTTILVALSSTLSIMSPHDRALLVQPNASFVVAVVVDVAAFDVGFDAAVVVAFASTVHSIDAMWLLLLLL